MELARCQTARGMDVRVVSIQGDENASLGDQSVRIVNLPCHTSRPIRDVEFAWALRRFVRSSPVDVVHFHAFPLGAMALHGLPCATILQVDYFAFRGSHGQAGRAVYRHLLKAFDCIAPVSRYCLQEFDEYWGPIGIREIVPNGVNVNQFRPDQEAGRRFRRAVAIPDGPLILYVGRVNRQKGTDVLISAFDKVKVRVANAQLVVVGPAGQFGTSGGSDLTERIKGVGGHWLGAVDESLLAQAFNMADVFVMPTRELEMFGMAALEAQACGVPVVCSRLGGLPETVGGGGAIFFPPGDATALADAIEHVISEGKMAVGETPRRHAVTFSWEAIAEQLESVYRSALMSRRGAGAK
jgi:glycosyltransferase involved in cell wall biosynthesis